MIDYKIIGERLKKARKNKGISQQKWSDRVDFSIAYLSRIERGSANISLKRLSQICDILEVSEGSILNGTSGKSKNYLKSDFGELFNKCTEEQKKLIYEITKIIIKN